MTIRSSSSIFGLRHGILLIVIATFFATSAHAAGFGAYLGYVNTDGTVEQELGGSDLDHSNDIVDFGFVLDTNLAQDRTFNYRLNLGIQIGERKYELGGSELKEKTVGFSANNIFGIGIVRTEKLRVWLGPSIRIGLDGCTNCDDYDSLFVSAGGGADIGINFNVADNLTIGSSFGYQYMFGGNFWDNDFDTYADDGGQHHIAVLVNILFRRSGDQFR